MWVLISTFSYVSTQGRMKKTPGPLAPPINNLPSLKITALSYSCDIIYVSVSYIWKVFIFKQTQLTSSDKSSPYSFHWYYVLCKIFSFICTPTCTFVYYTVWVNLIWPTVTFDSDTDYIRFRNNAEQNKVKRIRKDSK